MDAEPEFPHTEHGRIMLGLEIAFIINSTLIITSRIYIMVKASKARGLDDYLAVMAYVSAF